jgi:hypothetical protein
MVQAAAFFLHSFMLVIGYQTPVFKLRRSHLFSTFSV